MAELPQNIEDCKLAWHVFIQWLATEDLLDWWLVWIVDSEIEEGEFQLYHKYLIERGNGSTFHFLRYTYTCPSWCDANGLEENEVRAIADIWEKVAKN